MQTTSFPFCQMGYVWQTKQTLSWTIQMNLVNVLWSIHPDRKESPPACYIPKFWGKGVPNPPYRMLNREVGLGNLYYVFSHKVPDFSLKHWLDFTLGSVNVVGKHTLWSRSEIQLDSRRIYGRTDAEGLPYLAELCAYR